MLVALTTMLACDRSGEEKADLPTSGELGVLTYNVHGLPPAITGDDTDARIAAIGPLLPPYDIVGLQEVWDDDSYLTLAAASGHETRLRSSEMLDDRAYGSGLAVFTDLTVNAYQQTLYDACNGFTDGASDCLASKGFQVARLQVGSAELDLYNTHMEAGSGEDDVAARQVHVEQLAASFADYSADRAVLFIGDTNLHGGDGDDDPLIEQLMAAGDFIDACEAVACDDPGRIDKVLLRSSEALTIGAIAWSVETQFVDEQGVDLSDHEPIRATLTWETH